MHKMTSWRVPSAQPEAPSAGTPYVHSGRLRRTYSQHPIFEEQTTREFPPAGRLLQVESTLLFRASRGIVGASRGSSSRTKQRQDRQSIPIRHRRRTPQDERAHTEVHETEARRRARGGGSSMTLLSLKRRTQISGA